MFVGPTGVPGHIDPTLSQHIGPPVASMEPSAVTLCDRQANIKGNLKIGHLMLGMFLINHVLILGLKV